MKRIFTITLLGFFFYLSADAQQFSWTKKTGPYGGYIGDIQVHPTNLTVYAIATQYSSGSGGPLYRSTDNGGTWTEQGTSIFGGDAGNFVDIKILANGTIFLLSYNGCCSGGAGNNLYKSTDDGTTWTKLNTGNGSAAGGFDYPQQVAYNSFSGTIYVFGQDNGTPYNYRVYRSTNGGVTFSKGYGDLTGNFNNVSITSTGDIYSRHSGSLYKSTDDGSTFTDVGSSTDLFTKTYLTAKSDGSELMLITNGGNMFVLKSPFTSWTTVGETGIPAAYLTSYGNQAVLGYSLDNSVLFLADNYNHIFYSGSSAGTWTSKTTSFINTSNDQNICIASKDVNNLYVGSSDVGLWKSINGGAGWNESDNGIETGNYGSIITADNGNIIVAGTRASLSTDNGTTWSRLTSIANNGPNYFLFKATSGSPAPIVALSQNGSYKSTDNGVTWSSIAIAPGYTIASTDGTNIAVQNTNAFYYTHNQGTSWSAALTVTSPPAAWPSGSYNVYQNNMAVDGTNGVIYAYLFDNTSSSYKFFKLTLNSTTAPTSFTPTQINLSLLGSVNSINAIAFLNGKVYASWYGNSGPGNVSFSSDGGTTWTTTSGVSSGRMDVDPKNNYLFVTGSNGNTNYTINLTRDGGSTFSSSTINTTSNKANFYGVTLSSSGTAYAGLTYSSIYATTGTVITPVAPTSLQSSGAGTTRVTLNWIDNATNEDHFVIQKFNGTSYDSIGYAGSSSSTGGKLFFEVTTGLQANTSYTFRVYATNAAGSSSAASVTFSTLNSCVSAIPDNRSWNGSVAWSNSTPGSGTTSLTNISIKSLGNGYYSITDISNGAVSGQSANISGTFFESCTSTYLVPNYPTEPNTDGSWNSGTNTLTLKYTTAQYVSPVTTATVTLVVNGSDPTPAAPTSTAAYVYDNSSIQVSWIGSAFETQYIVERSSVDNTFATIDKTYTVNYPSKSVVDNASLNVGTTYYYRVKAKNGSGTSAPSNTASATFKLPYFVLAGTTIESTQAYSGTGAIWGDFNNDGFDDLIIPQLTFFSGTPATPLAFKNNGAGNFVSVSTTGFATALYVVGSAGDYDNDGKLDLFFTADGNQNYLYKGNGDFTFTQVSATPLSQNYNTGTSQVLDLGASWADYNNDGLLDLFVATNDNSKNSKLFTQGPVGTFTLATSGGLQAVAVQGSVALWADYDNDGDQDIFIADGTSSAVNRLYKNNGNGTFTRVTGSPFDTDIGGQSFSAAWADYNNDGNLDLFIGARTNNLLYKNNGNGTFTKQSFPTSVTETLTSSNDQTFGSTWGDINNDGYLDLLVTVPGEESRIYINNSGTTFTKVNTEKFNDIKVPRFGLAFSDYNQDGFLDLASAVIDPSLFGGGFSSGPTIMNQVFKNNTLSSANTNWIEFKITGTTSNKMGIGTRITVTAGGKTQIREVATTASFCSQPSQTIHFGLGASATITSLQVKWPSGIVQNLSNVAANQILNITEDNTGPVAATLSPANSATNVNGNTTLAITLNEPSTATSGKFITLYKTSDLVNAVASFDVSTVSPSGNTFTYTLPAHTLLASTSYSITVDAGAFKDIYSNPSLVMAAAAWQFTTAAGPSVTLLNPLNNANGVAIATPIEITFNVAVTPVSGKNINLFIQGSSSPSATLDVTTGAISGNKISYTLASPLGYLNIYDVNVDAGAFQDANGNQTVAITWSFVTLDNIPPVITFSPPGTLDKNFSSTLFAVTATDNSGQVSSATLSYRKIGGGTFTDLAGTFDTPSGKWDFTVQESFFDGNGMEFYLTAKDPSNNIGRLPVDPTTDFYVYYNYKQADNVIPSQQLGFGGTSSSWKIFTVPFDLGTNDAVSTVLDELSSLTLKVDWRMLTYQNTTSWAEYPTDFSTVNRGQGYFINIKTPQSITAPTSAVSPNNRKNLFLINLKAGWNQIGNPYLTSINWADVVAFNSISSSSTAATLKTFASGSYNNAASLQPFEGGFVNIEANKTISIPFAGQTTIGGRQGGNALGDGDWIVPLTLTNGDIDNTFGGVGMNSAASTSYDQFDDINAPRFINYLEMNFAHPEHFAKEFARDVVPQMQEYTWEFTVNSNVNGVTDLKWADVSNVPKEIFLYDLERETVVNMKENNTYSFVSQNSARFRIYYGDDVESKIRPQGIILGDAFPNPSAGSKVTIPFALPESQASFQISLEIYNSMGQKVSTLASGTFNSGFYSSQWEPNQDIISGLYIYRLKVDGKTQSSVLSKKIVVNH